MKYAVQGNLIVVEGPKGKVEQPIPSGIKLETKDGFILATRDSDSQAAIHGLTRDGVLLVLGLPEEPIPIIARELLSGRSVKGSAGGVAVEAEDTMNFSVQTGVRPMIETLPLERAAEAYEKMMSGKARFRMVLTTGL